MVTGNWTAGLNMNEVQEDRHFSEIWDTLSLKTGHYIIIAGLLFFVILNWIIKSFGPPKSFNDDEWKWRNLMVSFVHSAIASVWVLIATYYYPELYWNLLIHVSQMTYYCVCFSEGYFLYDLLDLIVNNKFFSHWELSLHHITIVVMFYYNLHIKAHIGFSIVALSVEINSVFLHCRKLLQMVKMSYDSPKYIVIKYLNILTFLIFRGGALVTISSGVFLFKSTVSTLYLVGISVTTFVMDVLNAVLFYRILKSDLFRRKNKSSSRSTAKRGSASSENDNFNDNHVIVGNNNVTDTVKLRKSGHQ